MTFGLDGYGHALGTLAVGAGFMTAQDFHNVKAAAKAVGLSSSKGKVGSSGNVKQVSFTHKPRKGTKTSRYDKVNCLHGRLNNQSYGTCQIDAGKQYWGMTNPYSNYLCSTDSYFFNDCIGLMYEKMQAVGGSIPHRITPDVSTLQVGAKLYEFVWQRNEYQFSNINSHAVTMTLYDMVLKKTVEENAARNDPLDLMILDQTIEGDPVNTDQDMTSVNDLDYRLKSRKMSAYWRIANKTTVTLAPGEQFKYNIFHRMNFIYERVEERLQSAYPKWPGITKMLMVNAVGQVVHKQSEATDITRDGVNIEYVVKTSTYLRERTPFYEPFNFKVGSIVMPTGARNLFTTVEEGNPSQTLGFN